MHAIKACMYRKLSLPLSMQGLFYRRRLMLFEHNASFKGIRTVLLTLKKYSMLWVVTLPTQPISLVTLGCFIEDVICDLRIRSQGVSQCSDFQEGVGSCFRAHLVRPPTKDTNARAQPPMLKLQVVCNAAPWLMQPF